MISGLPSEYSAGVKKDTIDAVIDSIDKQLRDGGAVKIPNLAEAYYCAGFGMGLDIVSSDELPQAELTQLQSQMQSLLEIQDKIISIVSGDEYAEIVNFGKQGGTGIPGWEDGRARQKLVTMILTQLKGDAKVLTALNKKPSKQDLAQLISVLFYDWFLFGIIDSLLFTRPSDFPLMTSKIEVKRKDGTVHYDIVDFIPVIRQTFNQYDFLNLLTSAVGEIVKKKPGKKKQSEEIKQPKIIETADEVYSLLVVSRLRKICLGI